MVCFFCFFSWRPSTPPMQTYNLHLRNSDWCSSSLLSSYSQNPKDNASHAHFRCEQETLGANAHCARNQTLNLRKHLLEILSSDL
jgi:hypothetical protein